MSHSTNRECLFHKKTSFCKNESPGLIRFKWSTSMRDSSSDHAWPCLIKQGLRLHTQSLRFFLHTARGGHAFNIISLPPWHKAPRLGEPHATDSQVYLQSVGLFAELLLPGTRQRRAVQSLRKNPMGSKLFFVINCLVLSPSSTPRARQCCCGEHGKQWSKLDVSYASFRPNAGEPDVMPYLSGVHSCNDDATK